MTEVASLPLSGVSLSSEFVALSEAFGYRLSDVQWLTINAMKSAFAPFDERLALINTVIKPGSASAMAPPVTTRPAARQSVVAGHDGRFRDARHDGFGLPASDLWSIAQPLDLDDEHELIGRVDQKGHESFVAIAEVQGAKWLGRVSRLANVMLVFKGIDDDRSVHQLGQGYPDFY